MSGKGYWVLGGDGRLQNFGDAAALGAASAPGATPIDFATTSSGTGAWVLGDNGAIVALGNARRMGDLTNVGVKWSHPAVGILASLDAGYLLLTHNGGLYARQTTFRRRRRRADCGRHRRRVLIP